MTRLWLTFFNSVLLLNCAGLVSGAAGTPGVSGTIQVTSGPKRSEMRGEDLSDIVVWLEPIHAATIQAARPEHATLLQKDKMFHPHTLAVTVGSIVDFPNKDPIFHNAFSSFDGQIFDVNLYPPGTSRSVRFHETGIVRVFCNIHPSMSAVILVLDTPYFTKPDRAGHYEIANVSPGTYQLHVFDERATEGNDSLGLVTVEASEQETLAPPVHLSEAGYVHMPHKNKYGMDYAPGSDDTDTYRGPIK